MSSASTVTAKAEMLIRRPVAQVFEAFVDPAVTSKFWFTKGSGRLETGKQVQWEWEMYGVAIPVTVRVLEQDKRILVEWPGYSTPTTIEWMFTSRPDNTTFVTITNAGFSGDEGTIMKQALDATEGFTLVLCGLKAYLEHGIQLNLVADRFPEGNQKAKH